MVPEFVMQLTTGNPGAGDDPLLDACIGFASAYQMIKYPTNISSVSFLLEIPTPTCDSQRSPAGSLASPLEKGLRKKRKLLQNTYVEMAIVGELHTRCRSIMGYTP